MPPKRSCTSSQSAKKKQPRTKDVVFKKRYAAYASILGEQVTVALRRRYCNGPYLRLELNVIDESRVRIDNFPKQGVTAAEAYNLSTISNQEDDVGSARKILFSMRRALHYSPSEGANLKIRSEEGRDVTISNSATQPTEGRCSRGG